MSAVDLMVEGALATLKLNNPQRHNCLTVDMLAQLAEHLEAIAADERVRGLIITGAGDKSFCAGADISAWGALSPAAFSRRWVLDGHRIFDRLARLPIPTIAAINGHAMGGGLELATACDIRVMSPQASLSLPEPHVGVIPGWSGTQRLSRLLPEPVIKELALFGRRLSAERALALGFVAELSTQVHQQAVEMMQHMLPMAPLSIEVNKRMLHAARNEDAAAMVDALAGAAIAATADKAEGVAAFQMKRPPSFGGH